MATSGKSEIPEPNEKLVKVFDSYEESEVMVVRGLLDSAGIETITTNLQAPQDVLPGVGGVVLYVREEQAGEALQLIEDYRASAAAEPEDNLSEEPPAEA